MCTTVRYQLQLVRHNTTNRLDSGTLASNRNYLIKHSSHAFPPAFACFAGLGSAPHNLYRIVAFDKLHVVDVSVTRLLSDHTHAIININGNLPLSLLMTIINDRFNGLPTSFRVAYHRPFRSNKDESQAVISGRMRRESVPFLWL